MMHGMNLNVEETEQAATNSKHDHESQLPLDSTATATESM